MATPSAETLLDLPKAMSDVAVTAADWFVVLPVVIALMGGALLLVLRGSRSGVAGLASLFVITMIVMEAGLFWRIMESGPVTMTMGNWLPPFGISFTADVIGVGFALTSAVVTLAVLAYVQTDITQREIRNGFYSLVMLLLGGVTGAFLTGDLFNLYVWFEVMLIASFGLLIMGGRKIQLDAAVKYGFLNFLATTFFLASLGYLYGLLGTMNMADIIAKAAEAPQAPMTAIAALMLLAFGTKAAAFPVNAWLPASYHAPSAAVSALFGGLLTKVGAYALLRDLVVLMPAARDNLEIALTVVAVLTLVIAPLGAIAQTNLRRAVGFLLMGGIGSILAGIAVADLRGIAGAGLYAFSSIVTITAMYLVAGLIEKMTGEQDTRRMGGMYTASSVLSILFLVLVFALAGMPPFLGFWPKIILVESGLALDNPAIVIALVTNAVLTAIAGTRLWAHIFWRVGREGEQSEQPNVNIRALNRGEYGWALVPTIALVLIVVGLGVWPNALIDAGRIGAADMMFPERYIASTGLEAGQ